MNTDRVILFLIFIFLTIPFFSQDVYYLWDKSKIPFSKENDIVEYEKEAWGTRCVFEVTKPTLTVYKAKGKNTGKAVIIIPGGGFEMLAIYHEGYDLAKVLAENGITAGVLKYRIPNPKTSDQPHLVPITDARKALKILRKLSGQYGIDNDKVGVVGFSAGSHLSTVLSLWKSEDSKENPNFSGLIYGVTDLSPENLKWLEESLYFRKLNKSEIEQNTLLNLVSEETPPSFIVHAYDDDVCYIKESLLYAEKLNKHKVNVEMHLFQKGGHGFGLGRENDGTDQWVTLFINWLKLNI